MQAEMEHYCRLDVHILAKACLKYRRLLLDATSSHTEGISQPGIDPFNHVTAAGVSHAIYRTKMLTEQWRVFIKDEECYDAGKWVDGRLKDGVLMVQVSPDHWEPEDRVQVWKKEFVSSPIAQIPLGGYAPRENHSKVAITWLRWMEHLKRTKGGAPHYRIRHACSVDGEQRISRPREGTRTRAYYSVDGFCQADNTIYEFYGCRYVFFVCSRIGGVQNGVAFIYFIETKSHSLSLFPKIRFHGHHCVVQGAQRTQAYLPHNGKSAQELYSATIKREQHLRDLGYTVVSIFECQFRNQMASDQELSTFADTVSIQGRLDPRDAFFGGRTNALRLHFKKSDDEVLKYYDITR